LLQRQVGASGLGSQTPLPAKSGIEETKLCEPPTRALGVVLGYNLTSLAKTASPLI